jgi:hypothetical protein
MDAVLKSVTKRLVWDRDESENGTIRDLIPIVDRRLFQQNPQH